MCAYRRKNKRNNNINIPRWDSNEPNPNGTSSTSQNNNRNANVGQSYIIDAYGQYRRQGSHSDSMNTYSTSQNLANIQDIDNNGNIDIYGQYRRQSTYNGDTDSTSMPTQNDNNHGNTSNIDAYGQYQRTTVTTPRTNNEQEASPTSENRAQRTPRQRVPQNSAARERLDSTYRTNNLASLEERQQANNTSSRDSSEQHTCASRQRNEDQTASRTKRIFQYFKVLFTPYNTKGIFRLLMFIFCVLACLLSLFSKQYIITFIFNWIPTIFLGSVFDYVIRDNYSKIKECAILASFIIFFNLGSLIFHFMVV